MSFILINFSYNVLMWFSFFGHTEISGQNVKQIGSIKVKEEKQKTYSNSPFSTEKHYIRKDKGKRFYFYHCK